MSENRVRPQLSVLDPDSPGKIVDEAIGILQDPGVMVDNAEARSILADHRASVDQSTKVCKLRPEMVESALKTAPSKVTLHSLDGTPTVVYEGNRVHFNPGSTAIHVLDYRTGEIRKPVTADIIDFYRVAESMENMDAQSTSLISNDVPEEISDSYRLFLLLQYTKKPIITGAFSAAGFHVMRELLESVSGGADALREKPRAVFDACPSAPLLWSDITCQNLIDCARSGIPAELVSMPLAGANAPATLLGSVVQHTAENLSGVVIHQLTSPEAPIIYGGSPAVFDMRYGTTPMGAIETALIDCAYAQVGKHLGLPTHTYLGLSDSKVIDTQAGIESTMGFIMATLAGINMVSGAGMLDFESCQSPIKLVIDNETCGMAKRLARGITADEWPAAHELLKEVGHEGHFLTHQHTLTHFQEEQFIPSPVYDRAPRREWERRGSGDTASRARSAIEKILAEDAPQVLEMKSVSALEEIMKYAAARHGMEVLPSR